MSGQDQMHTPDKARRGMRMHSSPSACAFVREDWPVLVFIVILALNLAGVLSETAFTIVMSAFIIATSAKIIGVAVKRHRDNNDLD